MIGWGAAKFQYLHASFTIVQAHLSKLATGGWVGGVDRRDIKEGDRVYEVEGRRGTGVENTVLLITDV